MVFRNFLMNFESYTQRYTQESIRPEEPHRSVLTLFSLIAAQGRYSDYFIGPTKGTELDVTRFS